MKVCIDPGHGGNPGEGDPGAVAHALQEADFNLIIASLVHSQLEDLGYYVVQTRSFDKFIKLQDRTRMANETACDIFISIHANAASSTGAEGMEVLYLSNDGKGIASYVLDEMISYFTDMKSRGLKKRNDLYVLKKTDMPAILIECGFLTNEGDSLVLKDEDNQIRMATAISTGVDKYHKSRG